jgi:hypothetical protein
MMRRTLEEQQMDKWLDRMENGSRPWDDHPDGEPLKSKPGKDSERPREMDKVEVPCTLCGQKFPLIEMMSSKEGHLCEFCFKTTRYPENILGWDQNSEYLANMDL